MIGPLRPPKRIVYMHKPLPTVEFAAETRKRTQVRLLKWAALALAVALAAFWWWSRANAPTPVQFAAIAEKPVTRVLAVVGRVKPLEVVDVRPERAGIARQLLVDEGAIVRRGQVLAVLEAPEETASLGRTQADRAARLAQVDQAQRDVNRARFLVERGVLAGVALENAQTSLRTAQAQLKASDAAIAETQARVRRFVLRAPFDGVVLVRPVDPGQTVGTDTVLFQVGSSDGREVEAEVDEFYADAVRVGMPAQLAAAGSTATVPGEVKEVAPRVDPRTGGRLVRLAFTGPQQNFAPGRTMDVNIIVDQTPKALSVPRSVLRRDGANWVITTLDSDDVARETKVSVLDWPGSDVVVTGGLKPGDRVVLAPRDVEMGARTKPQTAALTE
jgi:RND family efflux transporter MFP subunit